MKAVLKRVKNASVSVDDKVAGKCEQGWFILLGVCHDDTEKDAAYLVKKIASLRAFSDESGKINLDIKSINGSILVVSQFTLYADLSRGNRPGFTYAAKPEHANTLYEFFVKSLREEKIPTETGIFGANMQIQTLCDGPITLLLESPKSS